MKTIIYEMKVTVDESDSRFNTAEGKELVNKVIAIDTTQNKYIEKKDLKENEPCVNEL